MEFIVKIVEKTKARGTRDRLKNVAPNLFRDEVNGTYYGMKKIAGVRKLHCLETADRTLADRRLAEWLGGLAGVDPGNVDMTLDGLLEHFAKVRAGKALQTVRTEAAIIKAFRKRFPRPMSTLVSRVRNSEIVQWLATEKPRLRSSSYNRYRLFARQLFDVAVGDEIIDASPFYKKKIRTARKQKIARPTPTHEEFTRIVAEIRTPAWKPVKGKRGGQHPMHFEESADFAEFIGLAGLGQAEVASLEWEKINDEKIELKRRKTGLDYEVPVYPWMRPLVDRLREKARAAAGGAEPSGRVFKLRDIKKSLRGACRRLGLPNFSQRALRRVLIGRLWKSGVDVKVISEVQGHHDGGIEILRTYTETFGSDDEAYKKAQLVKAENLPHEPAAATPANANGSDEVEALMNRLRDLLGEKEAAARVAKARFSGFHVQKLNPSS